MTYRKRGRAALVLALAALLLLSGCGGTATPAQQPAAETAPAETAAPVAETPAPETAEAPAASESAEVQLNDADYDSTVTVNSVDGLLAALAPRTRIRLEPGVYDLSTAADYGRELSDGYYTWENTYDGYQLVIQNVDGLAIVGSGKEETTIAAMPRYANVLVFRNCRSAVLAGLTAGHTEEPGICAGGVLYYENCQGSSVQGCGLFGCGILGVDALNCRGLTLRDTDIYDCSYGAVNVYGCFDVRVDGCSIYNCGREDDYGFIAFSLLEAQTTTGFAVVNSRICDNSCQIVLNSRYCTEVCLLGTEVSGNRVRDSVFSIEGASPVVDGCSFTKNRTEYGSSKAFFYPPDYSGYAQDLNGEDLISFDLERMQRKEAVYEGPKLPEPVELEAVTEADGSRSYHVKTVDEFLAAIGPDTTIYLDAEIFDLSTASGYGGFGDLYYFWYDSYDGPSLVIANVSNLRIVGQGKEATTILAQPRYAEVLSFMGGENITLENFTAGHTDIGYCSGDVLGFEAITNLTVRGCGLFGCGVWGLHANQCSNVTLDETEIYSCSQGALTLYNCNTVTMTKLDIHDMPDPATAWLDGCTNVTFDGQPLSNGNRRL